MLMMDIGEVGMFMPLGCVSMPMGMRLVISDWKVMVMLVVVIVRMSVFMLQLIMLVFVGMVFCQV